VLVLLDMSRSLRDDLFAEVAKLYYDLVFSDDLRPPEKEVISEITSLRGELDGIDWRRRTKI